MSQSRCGCSRVSDDLPLNLFFLDKLVPDSLELHQILLVHHHRGQIVILAPKSLLDLIFLDGVKMVVTELNIELTVRL